MTERPGAAGTSRLRLGTSAWPRSLSDLVVQATGVLARAPEGERLVLLLDDETDQPERSSAAREALRSLVHASVLERPRVGVNLVVGGGPADRAATADFLLSPGADFVLGATVDLGTDP